MYLPVDRIYLHRCHEPTELVGVEYGFAPPCRPVIALLSFRKPSCFPVGMLHLLSRSQPTLDARLTGSDLRRVSDDATSSLLTGPQVRLIHSITG
jgi:hypothetical protein